MSDLIKRSEALNAINVSKDVEEAWENVTKLPSAQPEWIPCSERLPKEFHGKAAVCEVFLVTVKVDNHYYVDLAENFGCYIDDFWDTVNDWDEGGDVHVVAWMPLPKPYGGESDV